MKINKKLCAGKAGRKGRRSKKDLMRLREELIETHIPLVGEVADEVLCKSQVEVKYEELVSVGLSGLIEAINNYGPNCSAGFASYCRKIVEKTILDAFGLTGPVNENSCHSDSRKLELGENVGFGNNEEGWC